VAPRFGRSRVSRARPSRARRKARLRSVRLPSYPYEHMFQSSSNRLRAWLSRAEDILGDSPEDAHDLLDDPFSHPHRRPLRWERTRRAGAVAPRPAQCISPVRAAADTEGRDRAAY